MDIAFESPCPDYDRFCQDREQIANFKAFQDKPTVECSAVYCISKDSIGTPKVLDFSPKEGSRAGGTEVKVQLKDLPAFSESDVTVTVRGSQYVGTAQVLALHQSPGSTLQAGSALLTLLTPKFTSIDDFATITISVSVGGQRSASFRFEYMPEIVGAAQVVEFFPKDVFETEDLQLLVTMRNVERLNSPFSSAQIKARVQGLDVPATQIIVVSSSRIFTVVRMSLPYNRTQRRDTGVLEISLGRNAHQLGTLNLSVLKVPQPAFVTGVEFPSMFLPDGSRRRLPPNQENILKFQIRYLDPADLLNPATSASDMFLAEMSFTRATTGEQIKSSIMFHCCVAILRLMRVVNTHIAPVQCSSLLWISSARTTKKQAA
jgi:hypothetical protein